MRSSRGAPPALYRARTPPPERTPPEPLRSSGHSQCKECASDGAVEPLQRRLPLPSTSLRVSLYRHKPCTMPCPPTPHGLQFGLPCIGQQRSFGVVLVLLLVSLSPCEGFECGLGASDLTGRVRVQSAKRTLMILDLLDAPEDPRVSCRLAVSQQCLFGQRPVAACSFDHEQRCTQLCLRLCQVLLPLIGPTAARQPMHCVAQWCHEKSGQYSHEAPFHLTFLTHIRSYYLHPS